jgi:hypothetical protein
VLDGIVSPQEEDDCHCLSEIVSPTRRDMSLTYPSPVAYRPSRATRPGGFGGYSQLFQSVYLIRAVADGHPRETYTSSSRLSFSRIKS